MTDKQELQVREKKELRQDGETTRAGLHFSPEVDIYEREDALVIVADVPGSSTEGIQLDLQENMLNLSATVRPVDEKWKPICLEYAVGHYTRQFRLGQILDMARISALVKDGVLTVTLPKIEKALPRKIEVRSEV
jgi:HSP20 family protein